MLRVGCGERASRATVQASQNDYDWLGPGIYFWQSNPQRALEFATEKRRREAGSWAPAIVGAVIELGLCLDLTTQTAIEHVKSAHAALVRVASESETVVPNNLGGKDLLLRKLDCAVIRFLHDIRKSGGYEPIDTVSGIFIEGGPVYPGSGFHAKTHVQICVCNPGVIKGVFRVLDLLPP